MRLYNKINNAELDSAQKYLDQRDIFPNMRGMLANAERDIEVLQQNGLRSPSFGDDTYWRHHAREIADITVISDSTLTFGERSRFSVVNKWTS